MGRGAAGFGSPNSIESLGSSVYTRSRGSSVGHSPTKTSRLRSNIIKISCYLNGEADRSRCTVVRLPEECDTLGEILPKIHARMGMDKRICFASELFLPDGTKIKTYNSLIDAAQLDHAIIVGCGERFDPTTVPYDLLEAYLAGGGPKEMNKVKQKLKAKQHIAANMKAETVRESGHGVYPNSSAVVTARAEVVDANKMLAAQMRHEYMEQLMARAEQQKALVSIVQQNTVMSRMEALKAKERRAEMDAERTARILEEKHEDKERITEKRKSLKAKIKMKHDLIHDQYEQTSIIRNPYGAGIGQMGEGRLFSSDDHLLAREQEALQRAMVMAQ